MSAPTHNATAATDPPAPIPCASTKARQFDFWLGEWQVFGKAGKQVGRSRIEAVLGGCAIAEHWSSGSGTANDGTSLNLYNAELDRWEQFWVDAQGGRLLLTGGWEDGRMVLSGTSGKPDPGTGLLRRERISWSPNADGSVRQVWEGSSDDGKTWTLAFDGLYRHPDTPTP